MSLQVIVKQLRHQKSKLVIELSSITNALSALETRGRRHLSPGARRRIAAAQRLRWAKVKKDAKPKHKAKILHWTQDPKNSKKLHRAIAMMNKARLSA